MAGNLLAPACAVVIFAFIMLPGNALSQALGQFSIPTGSPNVAMIGPKSHFGHMLLDQDFVIAENARDRKTWDHVSLLYLNANTVLSNEQDLDIASSAVRAGIPVLIDGTTDHDPSIMRRISAHIGGVGFDDALIMIRRSPGKKAEYKVLFAEEMATESAATKESKEELLRKLADKVREFLSFWLRVYNEPEQRSGNATYKPEASINVEFYTILTCKVGANYAGWGTGGYWTDDRIEDACNGQGEVSLFFNIDLVRSLPLSGGGAENAKYVRITLDPETGGGGGWHLVDKPTHEHTWFQSWANRNCLFYPIAMDYRMEVYPNDTAVRLYNAVPSNVPKEETVSETNGFSVGVQGQVNVGNQGPKVGGQVSASYQYSSSKTVSYKVYEYTIINHSSGNKAVWKWDRMWDNYASGWRTHDTCALWCNDWFWEDTKFSAASYANYKTGFSVTFRADPHKHGTTSFLIRPGILIVSLGGRIQPAALWQSHSPYGYLGYTWNYGKHFDINWDGPIFQPEITVSIEVIAYQSEQRLCLDVEYNWAIPGQRVIPYPCVYSKNQLWGLDEYDRYTSRIGPNLCMQANSNSTVTIEECSTSTQLQRWEWSSGNQTHLMNTVYGYLAIVNGQLVVTRNTGPNIHRELNNYVRTPGVEGSITVY